MDTRLEVTVDDSDLRVEVVGQMGGEVIAGLIAATVSAWEGTKVEDEDLSPSAEAAKNRLDLAEYAAKAEAARIESIRQMLEERAPGLYEPSGTVPWNVAKVLDTLRTHTEGSDCTIDLRTWLRSYYPDAISGRTVFEAIQELDRQWKESVSLRDAALETKREQIKVLQKRISALETHSETVNADRTKFVTAYDGLQRAVHAAFPGMGKYTAEQALQEGMDSVNRTIEGLQKAAMRGEQELADRSAAGERQVDALQQQKAELRQDVVALVEENRRLKERLGAGGWEAKVGVVEHPSNGDKRMMIVPLVPGGSMRDALVRATIMSDDWCRDAEKDFDEIDGTVSVEEFGERMKELKEELDKLWQDREVVVGSKITWITNERIATAPQDVRDWLLAAE